MGTLQWVAPEVYNGKPHSFHSDVFSFGLVLFAVSSVDEPYRGYTTEKRKQMRKEDWRDPCVPPDDAPENLTCMMRECIKPEPRERPSMSAVTNCLDELLETLANPS